MRGHRAEARQFYGFQIGMETIHSHMYGLMIDTLITDPQRRQRLFKRSPTCRASRARRWALKWLAEDRRFAERLVAFACVEGSSFPLLLRHLLHEEAGRHARPDVFERARRAG